MALPPLRYTVYSQRGGSHPQNEDVVAVRPGGDGSLVCVLADG